MKHPETRKVVPGAKNAVLFLHGIVGTPNHFRIALPLEELVPPDWSVYNLRYPGHGGTVTGFGKSNMDQWRDHAKAAFSELAESHEKILIVGHSMGTLFAMQMALEQPEKVGELLLIAAPMRPWVRLFGAVNCLRLAFHCIREDHPLEVATRNVCGVDATPWVWQYIPWIPRFFELFAEIAWTEKVMGNLKVPCIAWQSRKDELVSNFAAPVLRKSGVMEVHELTDSTHFYYAPEDAARVRQCFEELMKKVSG
jgi:esterase/lipase